MRIRSNLSLEAIKRSKKVKNANRLKLVIFLLFLAGSFSKERAGAQRNPAASSLPLCPFEARGGGAFGLEMGVVVVVVEEDGVMEH